jgi:trimethylamine--corrinoid protein Co-methyltransferase
MICQVLSTQQITRIHEASLRILERTGVEIPHPEVLGRLEDAGATIQHAIRRARIPPDLVMKCLGQAGKTFAIYGRDISIEAEFGAGTRNYNSIAGEASWIDEPASKRRFARLNDVADAAVMGDALDNINIVGAMADPHDVPAHCRCVSVLASLMRNTVKPVHFWLHDRQSTRHLLDLTIALRGTRQAAEKYPLWYPFLEPISPLRFPFNGVDLLFETAAFNLPVPIGPMAQMGMSAPCTLAATMAQENAEILAGICITQVIRPGTPVCYGGICHAFDMRTTQLVFSGPEQAVFGVAMTEMGKHYGLPVSINVGLTDSKRPDAQAGLETGVTLMTGAAAGADIFGHMGISGVDQATSLDMLVLQNEVISYVESVLRRVDVREEEFALDEIDEVGPGGTFIDRIHTAENYRKHLWFPDLLDRDYYRAWLNNGALNTEDRCRQKKQHILETHEVPPLPADVNKALDDIVRHAGRITP